MLALLLESYSISILQSLWRTFKEFGKTRLALPNYLWAYMWCSIAGSAFSGDLNLGRTGRQMLPSPSSYSMVVRMTTEFPSAWGKNQHDSQNWRCSRRYLQGRCNQRRSIRLENFGAAASALTVPPSVLCLDSVFACCRYCSSHVLIVLMKPHDMADRDGCAIPRILNGPYTIADIYLESFNEYSFLIVLIRYLAAS